MSTRNMRLGFLASTLCAVSAQNMTKAMLDSIARMVDGSSSGIEDDFFNQLVSCMSQPKDLMASSDAAWTGFNSYYLSNGTADDHWGSCTEEAGCKQYAENNLTAMDVDGIGIYEPCNSASNLAYYRTALGVCDHDQWSMDDGSRNAMVQAYIHLAMGSFFWHGSHTFLGNVADNRLIDVLSFVAYQVSIEAFLDDPDQEPGANATSFAILRDLNETLRSASAVGSTQALTEMFIQQPVATWQSYIEQLDMPNYYLTFSALLVNIFNVLLSPEQVDTIFDLLAETFDLPPVYYDFVKQQYLPALRSATASKGISLSSLEKTTMGLKLGGVLVKMFYAFLWQEWVLTFGPNDELMLRPRVNKLGAALMPGVNKLANYLTGYLHTDPNVQTCVDVYPADDRCRVQESHSKWHEENGNGLLDLTFLSDDMLSVTSKAAKRAAHYKMADGAKLRGTVLNKGTENKDGGRNSAVFLGHGSVGHGVGLKNFATKMVGGYQEYLMSVFGIE